MRWLLVLSLSSLGAVFGLLSVYSVITGYEQVVATVGLVGIGKIAGFFERDTPIRHGFAAGAGASLSALWTQGILMPLYLDNNPIYKSDSLPFGLSEQAFTFVFSPLGAIVGGTLSLLAAVLFAFLMRKTLGGA